MRERKNRNPGHPELLEGPGSNSPASTALAVTRVVYPKMHFLSEKSIQMQFRIFDSQSNFFK